MSQLDKVSAPPLASDPDIVPATALTREDVARECARAATQWQQRPGRNLVLLFDGTGNILGNRRDTNVVRLMRMLHKEAPDSAGPGGQIVYYDPGVGTSNTFPASTWHAKLRSTMERLAGLALGHGAFENIAEAYTFLVNTYRPGDRIWLFGFSRGAFTARAVGGMVNAYGLVHTSGASMIPLLVTNYFAGTEKGRANRTKYDFADDICRHFSLGRTPLLHFVGVWDTVETIGSGLLGGITISNKPDIAAKRYVHVRHALALHEFRCKYKPRHYCDPRYLAAEKAARSFKECWFAGAHSDVGGSYRRGGLAMQTLEWMVDEAADQGLLLDQPPPQAAPRRHRMHDESLASPYWAWTGLSSRERDVDATIHPSALPLEEARPAVRNGRAARLVTLLGALLALAVIGIGWQTALATGAACSIGGGNPGWFANLFQLLAPWHGALGISCTQAGIAQALWWDWGWLAVYAMWLPFPVAWALRRLSAVGVLRGQVIGALPRNAQWLMLALVLGDAVENLLTYWLPQMAGLVFVASAVKFTALALLIAVVGMGALARPPKGGNAR